MATSVVSRKRTLSGFMKTFARDHRSSIMDLCDDALLAIISFLEQVDLIYLGQTCKGFRRLQYMADHLKYYMVFNPRMTPFLNHHRLESLCINGVKDLQLYFPRLAPYTFIGHYSSFHPKNMYGGLTFAAPIKMRFPEVKTLFIEEAEVSIDFGCFPNLENLFIQTSQLNLDLTTIDKCKKLKRLIVYIVKGLVYLTKSKVMDLPELEVLCVTGTIQGRPFTPVSPFLKHYMFYGMPETYVNDVYYEKVPRTPEKIEFRFRQLFQQYHKIPDDIRRNVPIVI